MNKMQQAPEGERDNWGEGGGKGVQDMLVEQGTRRKALVNKFPSFVTLLSKSWLCPNPDYWQWSFETPMDHMQMPFFKD